MTAVYVVQVAMPWGCRYVTSTGKLSPIPKFFRSAPTIRSYISKQGKTPGRYDASHHGETTIITIEEIEKGLKDSKASVETVAQFLSRPGKKMLSNPKAFYKIVLDSGKPYAVRRADTLGKSWRTASVLRRYITEMGMSNRPLDSGMLKGAQVAEIEMASNGVDTVAVRLYPIVEFYRASPTSKKNYDFYDFDAGRQPAYGTK